MVRRRRVRTARVPSVRGRVVGAGTVADRSHAELRHGRFAELRPLRLRRRPLRSAPLPGGAPPGRPRSRRCSSTTSPASLATRQPRSTGDRTRPIAGIPAGGLFTGAGGHRTAQAATYGGTAGDGTTPAATSLTTSTTSAFRTRSDERRCCAPTRSPRAGGQWREARATSTASPPNHPRRSRAFRQLTNERRNRRSTRSIPRTSLPKALDLQVNTKVYPGLQ